jgi:glycosyltransferase involved in cell wall biosynthesis
MKPVAILCVRNEEACVGRTIRHLIDQGLLVAVIDNGSSDATSTIVSSFSSRDVIHRGKLEFEGTYDLLRILEAKAAVARQIGADWIIHHDADEIMHSPVPGETLAEAALRVERSGANAINFHEFVFVPTAADQDFTGRDYVREMLHYYFFQPSYPRLTRMHRSSLSNLADAGHLVRGPGLKMHPQDFVMRHYIALSLAALKRKYRHRPFRAENLAKGWHYNRAGIDWDPVTLPAAAKLKCLAAWDSRDFDTSDPWKRHFWERPDAKP